MSATVLVGSLLGMLVALVYVYLGRHQARRAAATGIGSVAFSVFWYGIGVHAAIESLWAIVVALGGTWLGLGIFVLLVKIATGVAAVAGLVAYMLLIYFGKVRILVGVTLAYSSLLCFMTYEYVARVPLAPELRTWYAGLRYHHPEGAAHVAVAGALFLPPLVATIAYLSLLRYVQEPTQRRRILLTGASLAIFFAGFLLGWLHERWYWWGLIERVLALVAAGGVLWSTRAADAPAAAEAHSAAG